MATAAPQAFVPLRLDGRPALHKAVAVLVGTLFLAVSSWISIPMIPVPMTMQTFAVLAIGALYGWRLGALTVLAWLGEAALGLPVLAEFKTLYAVWSTAGYLVGFVFAAALVGWLAERGWTAGRLALSALAMVLGHVVLFAFGVAWLAFLFGADIAVAKGLTPFLFGSVLKSALAVAALEAARRGRQAA